MRFSSASLMAGMAFLAACSPGTEHKADAEASGQHAAAAVATSGGGGPVAAAVADPDAPKRKPGLWETTMIGAGRDGEARTFTTQMCLDEATDSLSPVAGRRRAATPDCTQASARAGGKYTFDSTCKRGERTITTHAEASGDFDKAYTVDVTTRIDPPREGGPGERKSTISAKWMGACPNTMKPGDVTMPGGMTFNLADSPQGLGGMRPGHGGPPRGE